MRPLKTSFLYSYFILALIALVCGSLIHGYLIYIAGIDELKSDLESHSQSHALAMSDLLEEKANVVRMLGSSPLIHGYTKASNARYEFQGDDETTTQINTLNERWILGGKDFTAMLAERMDNVVGQHLRRIQKEFPQTYGEIFVTNKYGETIATTGRLSTLNHRGEYWWDASWAEGKGRVFIDDRGYDKSVGDIVLGIAVPIVDERQVVGILKANIYIKLMLANIVALSKAAREFDLIIVRSNGLILSGSGIESLHQSVAASVKKALQPDANSSVIYSDPEQGRMISGISPVDFTVSNDKIGFGGIGESSGHWLGNQSEYWSMISIENRSFADMLSDSLVLQVSFLLIVVGVFFVLYRLSVSRLIQPVEDLTQELLRFSNDKTNAASADELTSLKDVFFKLDAEVSRRKKAEYDASVALAELTKNQAQILRVEKLSGLATFVGGVAHEINNPLMGLLNYVEYVSNKLEEPKLKAILVKAVKEIQRIKDIVSNLQVYVGVGSNVTGRCDVVSTLHESIAMISKAIEESNTPIENSVPPRLPQVEISNEALQQVIINVLLNAVYAMRNEADKHLRISAEVTDDWVCLDFIDSGVGVSPALRGRIFDPFFTTKPVGEGTGLGLSLCAQIMQAAGGTIEYNDAPDGKGAAFTLILVRVTA